MNHYRNVAQLGSGTYGTVFKAEEISSGEMFALKKVRIFLLFLFVFAVDVIPLADQNGEGARWLPTHFNSRSSTVDAL